jgi:hypothetical protein
MHRSSSRSAVIASLSALAGLAALGATLLVGPGAASPLPAKAEAGKAPFKTTAGALANQGVTSPTETARTTVENSSGQPRPAVRVVYVGPITAK